MPLSASQKWRARQLQPSVPFTEDVEGYQQQREGLQLLQEAYEEFTQAWTAIRQHDDPDFMSPVPTLEGIARALAGPDEALVYLVAGLSMPRRFTSVKKTHTLPGIEPGFALMVTLNIDGTPRVQALSLPKLQSNAIDTLLEPVSETATEAASGPGYTRVRLEEALETLGDLGLNELATALMAQGVRKIRLVPYVRMGLFPLAAVNIQIPGRPSCRFGDFFELTFVPNARTAEVARERAEALAKKRQTFLFGGNPQPLATGSGLPSSSLPFAADEAVALYHVARAAGYYSKDLHYLRPEEMTKKRVVALLQTATNAYLALHGMYRPERPRDSVLVLAGGQEIPEGERTLSLGEILDGKINLHNLRLLVLSACETSLYDIHRQPDEVVGLATGFLQAGVAGVIASLWKVREEATYLLITRFAHFALHPQHLWSPAQSLRLAQQWLRQEATNAVLQNYDPLAFGEDGATQHMAFDKQFVEQPALQKIRIKARRDALEQPEGLPYADPFYWAGFIVVGC